MSEHALIIVGAELEEVMNATMDPNVLLGVDVSWDEEVQMWRADWEGGVAFGNSKVAAVLNGFSIRLGVEQVQRTEHDPEERAWHEELDKPKKDGSKRRRRPRRPRG